MNYKFLSVLAVLLPARLVAKADTIVVEQAASKAIQETVAPLKLGYVDIGYILANLPEAKRRNAEMESFQLQLENEIKGKYKEYQDKAEVAQQQIGTLTEAQKKQKSMEFGKLQASIEALESQRYVKMEQKYKEVMRPLHDRIQEAIRDLAVKHKYTFVLNKTTETGPVVLFAAKQFDLSALVVEALQVEEIKQESKVPAIGPKQQPVAAKPRAGTPSAAKKRSSPKKTVSPN